MAEEQGDLALAESGYRKEIEFYPQSVPARFNLGKLLLKNGDFNGYMAADERRSSSWRPTWPRAACSWPAANCAIRRPTWRPYRPTWRTGLKNTQAPDLLALGWFLMADIYSRRHQPAKVQEALSKANHYQALQGK